MGKSPIRNYFLTGLLILLPLLITIYVLVFAFNFVDGLLKPIFTTLLNINIPGLGFIVVIGLLFITGIVATNVFGKKLIFYVEKLLIQIPLVRQIYSATKQIVEAFSAQNQEAFQRVVLVEYPRKGIFVIGFVTGESTGEIREKLSEEVLTVFIPTTPNPTSGFLILYPKREVIPLEMSIEEGLKLVISGGVVTPDTTNNPSAIC